MTKKLKHSCARALEAKEIVELIFQKATEMEEPLHEAFHLTCLISQVESKESEEMAGIAFAATKAKVQINATMESLRGLFTLCRSRS